MTGTVRFPLERAQDALDALPVDAPDEQLAAALADLMLVLAPTGSLIRLGIQFDARNEPCPVPVDKVSRDWCTVTYRDRAEARKWLIRAALTGCTVARIIGERFNVAELQSESLRHIRDRKAFKIKYAADKAKRAAMTPAQRQELDDEIPF